MGEKLKGEKNRKRKEVDKTSHKRKAGIKMRALPSDSRARPGVTLQPTFAGMGRSWTRPRGVVDEYDMVSDAALR